MNYKEFERQTREYLETAFISLNNITSLLKTYEEEQGKAPRNNTTATLEEVKELISAYKIISIYEEKNTRALYREVARYKLTPIQVEEVFIKVNNARNREPIKNIVAYTTTSFKKKREELDKKKA